MMADFSGIDKLGQFRRHHLLAAIRAADITCKTGGKGRGAWLQDARLRVSARRDLADSVIGTGIPFLGRGNPEQWAKTYLRVAPEVAGIRRFGSAALDLAWVAAGRMDGFWEDDLDLWDTAAGVLLVREAGGFVTDYRGADRAFERGEYVAGSASIHSKLQKLIAGALR